MEKHYVVFYFSQFSKKNQSIYLSLVEHIHEHEKKTQETAKGPVKVFESSSHLDKKKQVRLREKLVRHEKNEKGKIKGACFIVMSNFGL